VGTSFQITDVTAWRARGEFSLAKQVVVKGGVPDTQLLENPTLSAKGLNGGGGLPTRPQGCASRGRATPPQKGAAPHPQHRSPAQRPPPEDPQGRPGQLQLRAEDGTRSARRGPHGPERRLLHQRRRTLSRLRDRPGKGSCGRRTLTIGARSAPCEPRDIFGSPAAWHRCWDCS